MKKLSILSTTFFPLLILCFNGIGQPAPNWIARYNGPGNKMDQAREIVLDAQNNIIVTGTSQNKNGSNCIATVKYSNAGVLKWAARYTGTASGDNYPFALTVDANGNVYVTGRSIGSGTGTDIVTIKYDSSGVQQWASRYNGSANLNDVPGDLKVDASGNVFVTGYVNANPGVGAAIVTLKYNSIGNQKWVALYDQLPNNGNSTEQGKSLVLDASGNLYVTGSSAGMITIKYDTASGQSLWSRIISNNDGRKVLIDAGNNVVVSSFGSKIVKYDPAGTLIWEANASLPSTAFWDMVLDQTGNVYVTGEYDGSSSNHSDYATAKYNSAGTEQWIKTYNGSSSYIDFARSIALDGSGNIYVTGYTSVNNGTRNGGTNYGTIKYNNDGAQQWLALYDSPDKNGSTGFGVVTDASGNIYVTGESATKASSIDYATIKYLQGSPPARSAITNPVAENKNTIPGFFNMKSYPNPFSQNTIIEYQLQKETNVRLSVIDLSGHEITTLVNETKPAGVYKIKFGANKLPAGTYICRIQTEEYIETKKLIILR